jgi:hypothetical protein
MCCKNVEFWKWEVEAVWGTLTRAVALNGRTVKIRCAEETGMAPLFIILTIIGTSEQLACVRITELILR